jgi:hypothetical protein
MPFYVSGLGDGGCLWATTTSSTTGSSYNNPFYGALGGTAAATTTTVVWVNTAVTDTHDENGYPTPYEQGGMQQAALALYQRSAMRQQEVNAQYQRMILAQRQAIAEADITNAQARSDSEARALRIKSASDRARELLLSKLSPEQRESFTKNKWFIVEGGLTKTKYRIRSNTYAGNIDVLDVANNVAYRLCVHCSSAIPLEDHLLAQKIMLELAENDIVRLANRHAA